jgi:hypothetical protein
MFKENIRLLILAILISLIVFSFIILNIKEEKLGRG